jgi:hypothetical protein
MAVVSNSPRKYRTLTPFILPSLNDSISVEQGAMRAVGFECTQGQLTTKMHLFVVNMMVENGAGKKNGHC